jgi:hypothetical protein
MNRTVWLLPFVLVACTTTTDITQIGKDTYMVSAESRGGIGRSTTTQAAVQKAAQFCTGQGKNLVLSHQNDSGYAGWTPVDATVTFQCLSNSDPEYQRVHMRQDNGTSTVVIEKQ